MHHPPTYDDRDDHNSLADDHTSVEDHRLADGHTPGGDHSPATDERRLRSHVSLDCDHPATEMPTDHR